VCRIVPELRDSGTAGIEDDTNGNMGALPGRMSDLPVPDARRFSDGYLRPFDQES
jgi:hypothetical protein